jgi:hypothetical protein
MDTCVYNHPHWAATFTDVLRHGEIGHGLAEQGDSGADLAFGHLARGVGIVAVAASRIFQTQSEGIQPVEKLTCLDG